jgi:predicted phage terminase large subunit-like protein
MTNWTDIVVDGKRLAPEEALRDLDRADCEDSLYTFLEYAWRYIDPSPFVPGWPLEAIAEHLQAVVDGDIRKLVINIPPRMAKSTICSVVFPAWVWAQRYDSPTSGPTVPLLHASYALSLAMRDSVKCRRLIESPWYQSLWGGRFQLVGDQNTKGRFQNSQRGERLITAVDARVTGEGGNIIVVDDPNAANEALSRAMIEACTEWWDGTMSTRLNDSKNGAFVVIQQRLGEQDLTGHILETDTGWTHLCLPMKYEPDRSFVTLTDWKDPRTEAGELLWPDRFNEAQVKELEKRLGPWKAAGQLQQRPEPAGGGIIKREWWEPWPDAAYPPMDFIVASVDTAYTTKTENDYSAMTVWGVFSGDVVAQNTKEIKRDGNVAEAAQREYGQQHARVMLMTAWQERLELHDLVKKIAETCKSMKVDKLLIEDKAAGHSVAQEMRRMFGYEDFTVQLINPGAIDKMARLYSIQHLFAEGMIYAPDRSWSDMVITQCGTFPKARHDDLCFVGNTLITLADGTTQRIDQMRLGDMVATPSGPARVVAAACTGKREIWHVRHEHGDLYGTGNHPVWADGSWKMIETLYPYDMLETLYPLKGETWVSKALAALKLKASSSTVANTIATQIQPTQHTGVTLRAQALACIAMSGSFIRGLFQMAGKSITSMETQPTMPLGTWNVCRVANTGSNITPIMWRAENQKHSANILPKFALKRRNGIAAKKGASGIVKMPTPQSAQKERPGHTAKVGITKFACGAAKRLLQRALRLFSAMPTATKSVQGSSAVLSVSAIRTTQPVYNLTIEGAHCYYANGVLVHNCDTVSMTLRHMRDIGLLSRSAERLAEVQDSMRHRGGSPKPLYDI